MPEDSFEAFLSAPVIARNRVVGVINVQHRAAHQHTGGEMEVLTTVGEQVGCVLVLARMAPTLIESATHGRVSYGVAEYMQRAGYRIIPVNPNETSVLGETAYPSLDEVPEKIDIVNVFRQPEFVPEVVDASIRLGVKAIWMQEGVVHDEGAGKARAAGIYVVMDRCILKEHKGLHR